MTVAGSIPAALRFSTSLPAVGCNFVPEPVSTRMMSLPLRKTGMIGLRRRVRRRPAEPLGNLGLLFRRRVGKEYAQRQGEVAIADDCDREIPLREAVRRLRQRQRLPGHQRRGGKRGAGRQEPAAAQKVKHFLDVGFAHGNLLRYALRPGRLWERRYACVAPM